jgi:uncharacterized protein (TIGR02246 family)
LRRFRSALTLLPAVILFAACRIEPNPRPAVMSPDSAARMDIRAAMDDYRQALLQGDARAVAEAFTPDARLSESDAADLVGSAAIREAMQSFFDNGGRITVIAMDSDGIDVDGAMAYEFGTYEERFQGMDGEGVVRGRYTIRWRRGEQARWRIDRLLSNHLPPDESVPDPAAAPR